VGIPGGLPLLAYDTARTVKAAKTLYARAGRPNLFIKIPGTPEGLPAITEAIAAGIPVNLTLLFSSAHYLAAADAYLQGVERRIAEGLDPAVGSVASVFMSRWDTAVAKQVPADLADKLSLAVGLDIYRAYRALMSSDRFQRLEETDVPIPPLRQRPAYAALAEHYAKIEGLHLRELFAQDPTRGERLTVLLADLDKVLAAAIIPELESAAEPELRHDSSTNTLIQRYRALKG